MKNIQDLIDNENLKKNRITRININKILGPLHKENDKLLKRIDLNQKEKRQIWLKESTVNLIKFSQYFNLMDDEQFFRQRKKIIKKFADIEKESEIIDGIQTQRGIENFKISKIEMNHYPNYIKGFAITKKCDTIKMWLSKMLFNVAMLCMFKLL